MPTDTQLTELPNLVAQAVKLAAEAGFNYSSSHAVGRLLAVLTAQLRTGTIAEIGTGYGVGAAWIAGSLNPKVRFVTVELDEERASVAQTLLSNYSNVQVLHADWRVVLEHAPFELIFADGGNAKETASEMLINALAVGGTLILPLPTFGRRSNAFCGQTIRYVQFG
jgi:predicted O-methyltransferase YrrM